MLCLQELTPSTLTIWTELLNDAGYHALAARDPGSTRNRPLRVLTAAREPLQELPVSGVPWCERVLAIRTQDGTEIVDVHSPTSPKPDLAKIRTHEAVFARLARSAPDGCVCSAAI